MEASMQKLVGTSVRVIANDAYPEAGAASIRFDFSNGAWLRTDYWRVIKDGRAAYSSFDHQQQYGLPSPFNAIDELCKDIDAKQISNAQWDKETGDLVFQCGVDLKLQVLNLTGYEVWEIRFPDGTGEYSNYAK